MGIFFGTEKRDGQTFAEPPIPPFPGASIYGTGSTFSATPDKALQVPTVWACVGLLSNSVSMLPLETFQRSPAGVPKRVDDPVVITTPAANMTQSEWLHMLMASLLLRGNAYGLLTWDYDVAGLRVVTQIELLNPDQVKVGIDPDTGRTTYKLGASQEDRAADIWHVRGLTLPGSRVGLSPISYAAATLGVDIYSRKFANDFFADGAHPSSILSSDQPINQDQARTIKDRIMAAVRGREPVVIGAGLKWAQIQVSPDESQFLATQQANVAQIARFFWIPAEMVGGSGGNSMTYANVEQRSLDFLTYAVSFWLKRIEDAMFHIMPGPQYVRFNTAALLRTDAETAARVDVTLIAGKIKVPSEVRSERDLAPMTDAQKAEAQMVPLTITPTGGAKALPVAGVAPADSTDPEDQTAPPAPPKLAAVRSGGRDQGATDG